MGSETSELCFYLSLNKSLHRASERNNISSSIVCVLTSSSSSPFVVYVTCTCVRICLFNPFSKVHIRVYKYAICIVDDVRVDNSVSVKKNTSTLASPSSCNTNKSSCLWECWFSLIRNFFFLPSSFYHACMQRLF